MVGADRGAAGARRDDRRCKPPGRALHGPGRVEIEPVDLSGDTLDDLKLLIMHQANLRINEAVQKRLGLPDEKVFNNLQKYGNTSA